MTDSAGQSSPEFFPTTQWTLVQVAQSGSPEEMARAMEQLCGRYWRPIYRFLIRSGTSKHDAEDLTQALFEKMISEEAIREVRRERGKLRSYMLGMLRRLMSRTARHDHAQKRAGAHVVISLDDLSEDGIQDQHLISSADPEALFNQLWAKEVVSQSQQQLRAAFEKKKRTEVFDAVAPYLTPEVDQPPYRELAVTLKSTESAARQLLHRLRKKFSELLEQEVARTVMRPEDLSGEMEWLRRTMVEI